MRVAGIPKNKTVNAPVKWRLGPITVADATPVAKPALSPLVMGMVVPMLCAGIPMIKMVGQLGMAIGPIAILGYGIGIGAGDGGTGVRQTSGNPMSMPIIWQFANMGAFYPKCICAPRALTSCAPLTKVCSASRRINCCASHSIWVALTRSTPSVVRK